MDSNPKFTEADFTKFQGILGAMPLKTCEVGLKCNDGAAWHVDMHGCDQTCACDSHKKDWFYEINQAISTGGVVCPDCSKQFTALLQFITIRPI